MRNDMRIIVDFVHQVRKKHGIIPGPDARGLESEEYGEIGQYVYGVLVCEQEFSGQWGRISYSPDFKERVADFVRREIARDQGLHVLPEV